MLDTQKIKAPNPQYCSQFVQPLEVFSPRRQARSRIIGPITVDFWLRSVSVVWDTRPEYIAISAMLQSPIASRSSKSHLCQKTVLNCIINRFTTVQSYLKPAENCLRKRCWPVWWSCSSQSVRTMSVTSGLLVVYRYPICYVHGWPSPVEEWHLPLYLVSHPSIVEPARVYYSLKFNEIRRKKLLLHLSI